MSTTASPRKLGLTDIVDIRAYERERDSFRRHVIALKKLRRVGVGPFVTLVFENRDTIRFQIQEMARVERLSTDEAIEAELRVYNPLIPDPGHLSATLFVELTSDEDLRTWLPRLVGIETSVVLRIGAGERVREVRCVVDPDHAQQLTRDDITASVHYVHFDLSPDDIAAFEEGPVALVIDHEQYGHEAILGDDTLAELLADLRG
jgi:hypothetical protein